MLDQRADQRSELAIMYLFADVKKSCLRGWNAVLRAWVFLVQIVLYVGMKGAQCMTDDMCF